MGYGKNPNEIKRLISKLPKDFQESVDRAIRADEDARLDSVWESCRNLQEREQLAEIYLKSRDYYEDIKASENIWNHIFVDLGFNEIDNPFITLFNNFRWDNGVGSLYPDSCRDVCNAYARGVIDRSDFEDKHSLIYNPNLYSKTNGGNVSVYLDEWNKFRPNDYREKLEEKAGRKLKDKEIESFIFFGLFDTRPDLGILVPVSTMKQTMAEYKSTSNAERGNKQKYIKDLLKYDTKSEAVKKLLNTMGEAERAALLKDILASFKGEISNNDIS